MAAPTKSGSGDGRYSVSVDVSIHAMIAWMLFGMLKSDEWCLSLFLFCVVVSFGYWTHKQ